MATTSAIIRVDSAKLIQAAMNFDCQKRTVQTRTNQMIQLVNSLSGKWQGEASNAYRAKFNKLQGDIHQMMAMIEDYVNDLKDVAKLYSTAESTGTSKINQLMDDVIK